MEGGRLVKLFQIEEPDGSPVDPDAPGAAIGIDASGEAGRGCVCGRRQCRSFSPIATDSSATSPFPALEAAAETWQALFEWARLRAERTLARPVTHAVVAVAAQPDEAARHG